MEEDELRSIIQHEINNSLGVDGSKLANERMRLQQYYEGQLPQGNDIPDRSQITDRSVLSVINWLLPDLVRVFMSTDNVVSFEARKPQDAPMAKAATQYVNHIIRSQNEGFKLMYEVIKTSLIQKNGFLKVSFEDVPVISMNAYSGLTDQELDALIQEAKHSFDKYEIKQQHDYPDPTWVPPMPMNAANPMMGQPLSQPMSAPEPQTAPMLHDVRIKLYEQDGQVVIRHILPEEVLIARRTPNERFNGDHFIAHRSLKNITDLRLMGFDEEEIQRCRHDDSPEWVPERISRFSKDGDMLFTSRMDEAMEPVWITECFMKVDFDGDDIAELRKIVVGASGQVILSNEECDAIPIISFTPIMEPGRAIGMSVAELVVDAQETKSAVFRGILDSIYLSIVPRNIININKLTEDTFDDLNVGVPGSGIRVNEDGAITPLQIPFIGQEGVQVLEFIDQTIQSRTGVGPQNNIISPDVLNNQTAAGISMTQQAASAQIELICRVIAETGMKELARHVLGLLIRHQDKPRMVRLEGQFVEMNPSLWHEDLDINITVGLGSGNKEKTTRDLNSILQIIQPIVMEQKGLAGPYFNNTDLHVVLSKLTDAMGYREDFFPHLLQPMPQQGGPPPDPAMVKAQSEAQIIQMKAQADIQAQKAKDDFSMQQDTVRFQHQAQIEQQKAQTQAQLATQRQEFDMQLERERAARDAEREDRKLVMHANNEAMKIEVMKAKAKASSDE